MATGKNKGKSDSLAYTDYTQFPGPFSLNTKVAKSPINNPRKAHPKSVPKPKKSGTNPGF